MKWIVAHIKWIMMASGVATATVFYAALSPHAAMQSTFGEGITGPAADIVVRNWGVLVVATLSKLVFVGLVVTSGIEYMRYQAGIAVIADSLFALVFAAYLLAVRKGS